MGEEGFLVDKRRIATIRFTGIPFGPPPMLIFCPPFCSLVGKRWRGDTCTQASKHRPGGPALQKGKGASSLP